MVGLKELLVVYLLTCHSFATYGRHGKLITKDYCIIGAGPSGLQLGYFLGRIGRDYTIFEKNDTAGSFFLHYPRHRVLISINKRHTGSTNKEFNFRHDWNSLISHDESLLMKHYSKDYFPQANDYVHYLQDFASKLKLNIQYGTEIKKLSRWEEGSQLFKLLDQHGVVHICRTVVVCTGLWMPHYPTSFKGIEHAVGYEDMSLDKDNYEGKKVLILGRGNAGFETADHIVSRTAFIHMNSRSRIKMAYQTHYVGDVRAVNVQQVDTYQLKSLDGQFEADLDAEGVSIIKNEDGSLRLFAEHFSEGNDNTLYRNEYDFIIRCLGFKFDFSMFHSTALVRPAMAGGGNKYPDILPNYQAEGTPDLYFAGASTHSLDFKKSAGGFIHGYRYTTRALFRHLEWEYNHIPWPAVRLTYSSLHNHLLRRINEASGLYQMFGVLADIILIRHDGTVDYLEEVPVESLPKFTEMTGHSMGKFIVWEFEYGKNYSGPGKDVLHEDRVHSDVSEADLSNFLHPVLYYYSQLPNKGSKWEIGNLPEPNLYHHVVEDFLTDWTSRSRHGIPLRRFLEGVLGHDLRGFLPENCFQLLLLYGDNVPLSCTQEYLQGLAVSSSDGYVDFGSWESLI